MIIIMPPPPQKYDPSAWSSILDFIKRSMIPVLSRQEAVDRVLLQSPNGTTYSLTVDNAGTLTTTVENGNTPS